MRTPSRGSAERLAGNRRGLSHDPGLRHVDEREPGRHGPFKIKTPPRSYHIDILRLGYYQGNGARKVRRGLQTDGDAPADPARLPERLAPTGLIDCGNWAVSASWTVPSTAVSGVYLAHLVRDDTTGGSHDPVRRPERREPLRHAVPDLR